MSFFRDKNKGKGKGGGIPNVGEKVESLTKLNIKATPESPYQKDIILESQKDINNLFFNVLEYGSGAGYIIPICSYDNTDVTSFEPNEYVTFDGKMKLKTNYVYDFVPVQQLATGEEFSTLIYKNTLKEVNSIVADSTGANVTNIPDSQLVIANGDISLVDVEAINKINLTGLNALVLISFNSGADYYGMNNGIWSKVNVLDKTDIESKGLTIGAINALTKEQIMELKGASTTLRLAYYLKQDNLQMESYTDELSIEVVMQGKYTLADTSKYKVNFDNSNKITINFLANGTFTVNVIN